MTRFAFGALAIASLLPACTSAAERTDGGACTTTPLEATCEYHGFGSECEIACDFPDDCTLPTEITWTGGNYCCGGLGPDRYTDCVCDHGTVLCRTAADRLSIPFTTCEGCNLPPPRDAGPRDGGLCSTEPLTQSCRYRGYATPCYVACDFPSTCTFDVSVTWTDGYCCGSGIEYYDDCVCEGGTARCRTAFAPPTFPRDIPMTFCEFCGRDEPDAGDDAGIDDAGSDDAGIDDAGSDDAGSDDAGIDDAGIDDAGSDAPAAP